MEFNETFLTRFWKKVHKTDSCWLWTGALVGHGYGQIAYNSSGDMVKAHRASYLLFIGPIPEHLCVCHACDVSRCVNPSHLFLGTQRENLRDRNSKGRQARGESVAKSTLTEYQVINIRKDYEAGETQRVLAGRYGVSQHSISMIVLRKTWSHV